MEQVFRPAQEIVEATVAGQVEDRFLTPKTSNVKKYVNKYRAAFRPKDPTDLDFEVSCIRIHHYETRINISAFTV